MKKIIPIYFASDKNYLPYLTVAIKSLINFANQEDEYRIYILTNDLKTEDIKELKSFEKFNTIIEIADVNQKIEAIKDKLIIRDYYSISIYFRLFIPSMFPEYNKAIYLDSDIILNKDVAELFRVDIKDNYLGAVLDQVVYSNYDFTYYAKEVLNVSENQYFNSGVLIMNLAKFRTNNIEYDFYNWVNNNNFNAVAPDQDYLNITCKNSVMYLNSGWNQMPMGKKEKDSKFVYLIHYNMFLKPWKYENILYENYFWNFAKQTSLYAFIKNKQKTYSKENKENDKQSLNRLINLAINLANKSKYKSAILDNNNNYNSINKNGLVFN